MVRLFRHRNPRLLAPAAVLLSIAVMILRFALTYPVFSDVYDESCHIGAAVSFYEAHRYVRNLENPPLPRIVAGIPLWLSGATAPEDQGRRQAVVDAGISAFEIGNRVLMHDPNAYWRILLRTRAAMMVFPIAGVWYVYLLGRYLGTRWTGCLAAIFFSTDPTLLGHGMWVTTDVPAAAGFLAATYHGLRFLAAPTARHSIYAGLALGAAMACKFSCGLVLPPLALILLSHRIAALRRHRWKRYFRAYPGIKSITIAVICAILVIWACYGFDIGRLSDSTWIAVESPLSRLPAWLVNTPLPMPTLWIGLYEFVDHTSRGHYGYLNGQLDPGHWWYYFPEAILLKSPLSLIGCMLLLLILSALLPQISHQRRWLAILLPPLLFLLAAIRSNTNIGIRHVLPVIPFLYLLVVHGLSRLRLGRILVGIAIITSFVETQIQHPDYLAFFNALAGGPSNGGAYLLDSNLDWGQDIARLDQWLRENTQGKPVTLRVFGSQRLREWPHPQYEILSPGEAPRGLLAISRNEIVGLYLSNYLGADGQRHLEPIVRPPGSPIATVGRSILIYDLD